MKIITKRIVCIALCMLMFSAGVALGDPDDILDQQNSENAGYGYLIFEKPSMAQSFIPTLQYLTRVKLELFKSNDPDHSDIVVSIRKELHGKDLAIVTKDVSQEIVDDGVPSLIEFDIKDIKVAPGETYFIVVNVPGNDVSDPWAGGYAWTVSGPIYPNGAAWYRYPKDRWQMLGDTDFCFETYGTN